MNERNDVTLEYYHTPISSHSSYSGESDHAVIDLSLPNCNLAYPFNLSLVLF